MDQLLLREDPSDPCAFPGALDDLSGGDGWNTATTVIRTLPAALAPEASVPARIAAPALPALACHVGAGDHANRECSTVNVPEGTVCGGGNPATTGVVCSSGVCCVEMKLVSNPTWLAYPNPTESDPGWGGGICP